MIKRFKSIIIVLLVLCLLISGSSVVFAADNTSTLSENIVWKYTIYDENMQVKETGFFANEIMSNVTPYYTWNTSITLNNNDTVFFEPSNDSRGLYCIKGTSISMSYTLNRSAYHEARVRAYLTGSESEYVTLRTASSHSATFTAKTSDYYYGMITNYSSDPFTINSFSITF